MSFSNLDAQSLRKMIRAGEWTGPTSGAAEGYVQANLVMLPKHLAFDFLLFCNRNPKPCPILDVLEPGETRPTIAPQADIRTDLPKYRIFKNGQLEEECKDVSRFFSEDTVSFLIGCSFSFEKALIEAGISVRNIEEGKNVSMYQTNIACRPAGPFSSQLVVSMRPMRPHDAIRATQITTRFHITHGAPVHIGSAFDIGIENIHRPDFGDAVHIHSEETPVFWACGVTSTVSALSACPPLLITHSPGHMFVSDLKDQDMAIF